MTPAQIKALRGDLTATQAATLCVVDGVQVVSLSAIQKWECGQKAPSAAFSMAYKAFMSNAMIAADRKDVSLQISDLVKILSGDFKKTNQTNDLN